MCYNSNVFNINNLDMESYSRGRRGVPAKDVGVAMRARVQIPHSPPNTTICGIFLLPFNHKYGDETPLKKELISNELNLQVPFCPIF